jgi:hypothetical protein
VLLRQRLTSQPTDSGGIYGVGPRYIILYIYPALRLAGKLVKGHGKNLIAHISIKRGHITLIIDSNSFPVRWISAYQQKTCHCMGKSSQNQECRAHQEKLFHDANRCWGLSRLRRGSQTADGGRANVIGPRYISHCFACGQPCQSFRPLM